MKEHVLGTVLVDQFPVWEADGFTKKSGETDFHTEVWRDGVPQPNSVTILEIGSSGEYTVVFTPDAVGQWTVEVSIGYNKQVWFDQYYTIRPGGEAQMNVAYDDDISTLYLDVWLDRKNQTIPATLLNLCHVYIYNSTGALILHLESNTPSAEGVFRLSSVLGLQSDRAYTARVLIEDNQGEVITNQAFTTAG